MSDHSVPERQAHQRQRRRQVGFGPRIVDFPSEHVQPLLRSDVTTSTPSSRLSPIDLRKRLATHGYLFVPGLLSRSRVLRARRAIVGHLRTREVLRVEDKDEDGVGTTCTTCATTTTTTTTSSSSRGRSPSASAKGDNLSKSAPPLHDVPLADADTRMAEDAPDTVKMEGFGGISLHPDVKSLLECDELFGFFRDVIFGAVDADTTACISGSENNDGDMAPCRKSVDTMTLDYKWIRAVGQHQFTGVHADAVYMSRGSANLHTVWIPLGDVSPQHGTLAVIDGSHKCASYEPIRETYGRMDVDRDKTEGWLSRNPLEITNRFGGQWRTADFCAGDVLIFSLQTLHCSTTNMSRSYRLSCDVRFQPSNDPVDERWVSDDDDDGTKGTGHTNHGKIKLRSIDDARREWGI